jgi:hypothetical protein
VKLKQEERKCTKHKYENCTREIFSYTDLFGSSEEAVRNSLKARMASSGMLRRVALVRPDVS